MLRLEFKNNQNFENKLYLKKKLKNNHLKIKNKLTIKKINIF